MYYKIFDILDNKTKLKFIAIFLFYLVSIFLDLLSISIIPVLIGALLSPDIDSSSKFYFIFEKVKNLDLNILLLFIIFIFIIKNIFQVIMFFYESRVLSNLYITVSRKLLKLYFSKNLIEHKNLNPSFFVRNVITEAKAVKNVIQSNFIILRDVIVIFGIVLLLGFINLKITLSIFFVFTLFQILYSKTFKKMLETKSHKNMNTRAIMTRTILELFNSIIDIKLTKKEFFLSEVYQKHNKAYEKNEIILNLFKRMPRHIFEVVSILILCIAIIKFLEFNIDASEILIILSVLTLSILKLLPSFTSLSINLVNLKVFKPSIYLVSKELDEFRKKNLSLSFDVPNEYENLNFKSINFEDVNFSYDKKKTVISNLDLDIGNDNFIGITGKSGSGKSTFLNLFLGLIKPEKGKIFINGEDLENFKKKFHNNLSYVPQEIFLIDDTIKNNIAFGIPENEIDKNILESAVKNACVNNMDGLSIETVIGNNGAKISGGQKQRIAIARALYRKPEILILDEALNAIDLDLQNKIISNLKNMSLKLVIIVTHDLNLLNICDKKYLLENNKLKKL